MPVSRERDKRRNGRSRTSYCELNFRPKPYLASFHVTQLVNQHYLSPLCYYSTLQVYNFPPNLLSISNHVIVSRPVPTDLKLAIRDCESGRAHSTWWSLISLGSYTSFRGGPAPPHALPLHNSILCQILIWLSNSKLIPSDRLTSNTEIRI